MLVVLVLYSTRFRIGFWCCPKVAPSKRPTPAALQHHSDGDFAYGSEIGIAVMIANISLEARELHVVGYYLFCTRREMVASNLW